MINFLLQETKVIPDRKSKIDKENVKVFFLLRIKELFEWNFLNCRYYPIKNIIAILVGYCLKHRTPTCAPENVELPLF